MIRIEIKDAVFMVDTVEEVVAIYRALSDCHSPKTMGKKGGLRGGKRRAEVLSKERMSEIGKMAANARWGNVIKVPGE